MSKILSGKEVAQNLTDKLQTQVSDLKQKGIEPCIAIVRVGTNPSDISYEKSVIKKAENLGIKTKTYQFRADVEQDKVISIIEEINQNDEIHGCLMFRPLPRNLDENKIRNTLTPSKDLDCITDKSLLGVFVDASDGFAPCTAESAMAILDYYQIPLVGKNVVVIGRSLVIGKPVAMLLLKANAQVTICHSKTPPEQLLNYCQNADVIVSAVGRRNTISSCHVNGKQTIVDVGINFDQEGNICGDVDFAGAEPNVYAITPVPFGVGSVTTTILMKHLLENAMKKTK